MTFIGLDAHDGLDADFDGDMSGGDTPFQLFSLRNLINFLLGFSWTGISLWNTVANRNLLIGISLVVGLGFLFLFFAIIKQVTKLAENNSFTYQSTVNKIGEVYLTIPENMSGKGKVTLNINGSHRELSAMTEHDKLVTGTAIKVERIESDNILIVNKI